MRIPTSDDSFQNERVLPEIEAAVRGVLLDSRGPRPPVIPDLEKDVSDLLGGCIAVAVQSGTAAMMLALRGMGIGPGDEVITPPNSDLTTTSVVSHVGARFVLCDVEDDTMNLDPSLIEARITPRTKAIFPVHLAGHPADMDPILDIAKRRGLRVIEDACLSLGATYRGRLTGLIGDVGCLSFGVGKVISGGGDGGMVVTRNEAIAHEVRLLRGVGSYPSLTDLPPEQRALANSLRFEREGYFVQMNAMQAAILRVKLPHLAAWQAERDGLAAHYAARFSGTPVRAPIVRPDCTHTWRDYVVRVPQRDAVRAALRERGIATHIRYIPPVHLQPVHAKLGLGPGSFPVVERIASEQLGLPLYTGLRLEQVDEIAATVLEAISGATVRS
ncbi:MAG: DegT/DnrJ/EryC1/StrS family aminotransferase [Armatimonadetes bacterium]|nr:DegT/DnrJ/EryC1/StrS family aminotransferase [Armatimonadota bacterium]